MRLYGLPLEGLVGDAGRGACTERRPLWAGRFSTPPAPEAHALGRSLEFDVRLAPQDVGASVAHVGALRRPRDSSTATEADATRAALREVGAEIADGNVRVRRADEDVHSAIERAVTDRLGDLGAKLHAGRSRNDLVVTDLRLWLLGAGGADRGADRGLVRALVARAREHAEPR